MLASQKEPFKKACFMKKNYFCYSLIFAFIYATATHAMRGSRGNNFLRDNHQFWIQLSEKRMLKKILEENQLMSFYFKTRNLIPFAACQGESPLLKREARAHNARIVKEWRSVPIDTREKIIARITHTTLTNL